MTKPKKKPDISDAVKLVSDALKEKDIKISSIVNVKAFSQDNPFFKDGDGLGFYMTIEIVV
jgi:hypothetical protein